MKTRGIISSLILALVVAGFLSPDTGSVQDANAISAGARAAKLAASRNAARAAKLAAARNAHRAGRLAANQAAARAGRRASKLAASRAARLAGARAAHKAATLNATRSKAGQRAAARAATLAAQRASSRNAVKASHVTRLAVRAQDVNRRAELAVMKAEEEEATGLVLLGDPDLDPILAYIYKNDPENYSKLLQTLRTMKSFPTAYNSIKASLIAEYGSKIS